MPLDYGNLVDYINKYFKSGPGRKSLWEQLDFIEFEADQWLEEVGKPSTDKFELPLRDLPRKIRDKAIAARTELFGLDDLFRTQLDESSAFIIRKAPTRTDQGYGAFNLPREAFIRGVGAESADDIAQKLAYVTQTVQMERGLGDVVDYSLSGSTPRAAFLRDAAEQAFNAEKLKAGTRLVFDVETAGLEADKGIWQLSARLMRGDQEVDTLNLMFRNNMMDIGLYADPVTGEAMNARRFIETVRGGKAIDWIEPQDFGRQMQRFLDMTDRADYLIGQNTAFDVRMLLHGMEGQIKSSPEFAEGVGRLKSKIDQGKVVDTRLFSKMLLGDIHIAQELQRIDKFTPHSMENILLQTSFLEDLAGDLDKQGMKGWDVIREKLDPKMGGLHYGDVDTWFEDHLARMQVEILSGKRTGILSNASLADADMRRAISQSGAVTPFTRLAGLGGDGVDLTPIEFLAQHERSFATDLPERVTSQQLMEGGIFRRWMDEIVTKDGVLRKATTLTDSGFDVVQARAIDANIPFAGISSFERLISTAIGGTHIKDGPEGANYVRGLLGDLTGSAMIRRTEKAAIRGRRNVSLPMELIIEAEKAGAIQSQFGKALAGEGDVLQTARWSAFQWGTGQRDLALVADIISGQNDVDNLMNFLRNLDTEQLTKYGLTPQNLIEYSETLAKHGKRYGIQIGIMEGKNNPTVARVADLMHQLGFDMDSRGPKMRTSIFGLDKLQDFIFTTASMVDSSEAREGQLPRVSVFAESTDEILAHRRLTREMTQEMLDKGLDPNVARAIAYGKGDAVRANKMYSFLERNIPKTPRALGIAGAGIAGYYLFQKAQDRRQQNQVMKQQGYEDSNFYEEYRSQMGQEVPASYRNSSIPNPLETAHLMQTLDRDKLRHHQMGPGKHGHLFGG